MAVRDELFAIAEPVVQDLGFHLVDVEYAKEGPRWIVRVYLYRNEGVSLDDCQAVSEALGDSLEAADVVKTEYHLEVSSPGAERVLKTEREFKLFQGKLVRITAREPVEDPATGRREQVVHGLLGPVTGDSIQLVGPDGDHVSVGRDNVKQVRLALKSSAPAFK